MKNFYKTLKNSCIAFYKNFKQVSLIILLDMTFFVIFALSYVKIWKKMMVSVNAVMKLMDVSMAEFAGVQSEAQLSALSSQSGLFMAHYKQIGYYLGMLFVLILILWCIFQGINWFLTNDLTGEKKEKFLKFMGKFSLLTVIWWALFLLIISLGMKLSMNASMAAIPLFGKTTATVITLLLLFVLFYFAYTSYVLVPEHKMKTLFSALGKTAYKEYQILVPTYLFTAVLLVFEYLIFMKSFAYGGVIAGIFAVVIIFPTIAWSRFYAITVLEK